MYGGLEFMHKEKLSEAFMFPVCSISKAWIKMQKLLSRTMIVVISSFALKADYHHLHYKSINIEHLLMLMIKKVAGTD